LLHGRRRGRAPPPPPLLLLHHLHRGQLLLRSLGLLRSRLSRGRKQGGIFLKTKH
jgi:hypothetical protein